MAVQSKPITATASQWASARTHLERRIEYVRFEGVRYAIVVSGNSDRVYHLPADASKCPCVWWEIMRTMCAHMLAVELAATMDELAEQPHQLADYAAVYARCAGGCGEAVDYSGERCWTCLSEQTRRETIASKMAAARRRVAAEWVA